jgi:hypothetical protein
MYLFKQEQQVYDGVSYATLPAGVMTRYCILQLSKRKNSYFLCPGFLLLGSVSK